MPKIGADQQIRTRGWLIVSCTLGSIALSGCGPKPKHHMTNAKNTPIVISGGSITGHTHHTKYKDWNCGTTGQSCTGIAEAKNGSLISIVTSRNLIDSNGNSLNQSLKSIGPNWQVVITGNNDQDQTDNPSFMIKPGQGCNRSNGEVCLSFAICNSPAHFGPSHDEIQGGNHFGRSVCNNDPKDPCAHYHIQSIAIFDMGKEITSAQCSDPTPSKGDHGCLVCITDDPNDTDACEWQ